MHNRIFGVAGKPILHSKSPEMFNSAFEKSGFDAVYIRICAENAKEIIKLMKEIRIKGVNITSPFKEEIVKFAHKIEKNAEKIGAINTLVNKHGKLTGYNTDFIGIQHALERNIGKLNGKKVIVLGAGGAAKAAVYGLVSKKAEVVVGNRTFEKAEQIAEKFKCSFCKINEIGKECKDADVLLSCISSSERIIHSNVLRKELVIFDANYSVQTPLVRYGKIKKCKVIDGREWLIYQALPAFKLFTGKKPLEKSMRSAVYRKMPKKKNIALIGFMGSGKTTIGKKLADFLDWKIVDLDRNIEKKAGMKIREIFEKKGEAEFRKMESAEIRSISSFSNRIISCGGGAVNKKNVKILKKNCTNIWLWANMKTILKRIGNQDLKRPLFNTDKGKNEELLQKRMYMYAAAGDLIIDTENKRPEEIRKRLLDEINKIKN